MSKEVTVGTYTVSQKTKGIMFSFILIGILTLAVGFVMDKERIWQSILANFFFFASIAVGGLFFTAIQFATKAGWSATIRRISESLTSFLPYAFVLALFILFFGAHDLFIWLDKEVVANDVLISKKVGYLNMGAFAFRTILFFVLWYIFGRLIVGNSIKQDQTGDDNLNKKNVALSVAFILIFALSYSLFSVDFVMSLNPEWYSTIFGVYCFSGLFQSVMAVIIILTIKLMDKGLLDGLVNENHLHDLGKFLFAFTIFYAYIAFSQFMLIWYANIPEETIFYVNRAHDGWLPISYSLLVLKFAVPFLLLLPRAAKRDKKMLVIVSVLILVMQWVDNYWLIYPNFNDGQVVFSFQEIGVFLGFLGLFIFSVTRFLSRHNIVAIKDSYIEEAIHHHVHGP